MKDYYPKPFVHSKLWGRCLNPSEQLIPKAIPLTKEDKGEETKEDKGEDTKEDKDDGIQTDKDSGEDTDDDNYSDSDYIS